MNRYESNKMAMFLATQETLNDNKETVSGINVLADIVGKFDGMIITLIARDNEYLSVISGKSAAKRAATEALIRATLRIANPLYVFGRNQNDESIKAECDITRTDLKQCRSVDLPQPCSRVLALAEEHAGEIADYGISPEDIDTLKTSLETYNNFLAVMHQKQAESKAAREMLHESFSEINELLAEELDPMMETVKHIDEIFYNRYRAGRTVKHLRARRLEKNDEKSDIVPPEAIGIAA